MIEKNFRRLLNSAEEQLRNQTIEDWKLNQVNDDDEEKEPVFLTDIFDLVCQFTNEYIGGYAQIDQVCFQRERETEIGSFVSSFSRPSSKQLDEYKQRIDLLREQIDPNKLVGFFERRLPS